ncbi:unnamed protein product [Adineta steineri]|uniref:NHL repeat containing protein n=1 Tax=Adineta steineri TaxID=433720 RepID=A0A819V508_9BILA|nr:unnamed protein product [Adineta steineri]CAF4098911.1 unnamed protein product [Adineta steineri]
MVDWASQDRIFPPGYSQVDIRFRRGSIDSSLPYSVATNKRHNCGLQFKNVNDKSASIENLHHSLHQAIHFQNDISDNKTKKKNQKLLATYAYNINWPRSICCLNGNDGSIIVCEQERCRLILFTSQLMFRSTCGGIRGNGFCQFDSPSNVVELIEDSSSYILVADTNNRRLQCFFIGYRGEFIHKYNIITKEKPYFIGTNKQFIAVSCEKGFINCYLTKENDQIAEINLNKLLSIKKTISIPFCLCMDPNDNSLFISNPIASKNCIYQLSILGKHLRTIKLDNQPFLHINYLTFDIRNRQFLIIDTINSIIYSVKPDLKNNNVEILLKPSDNVNYPQALCISNEGHLVIVECSVLTQHTLKLFRYIKCKCHSRAVTPSVKTSETTSIRSIILP